MSADNWGYCPKCYNRHHPGVYSSNNLREDYDIGFENGEFSVHYKGSCTECGFRFEFKHKEQVTD